MIDPENPISPSIPSTSSHGCDPSPGTRCSSLSEPEPSARCTCARVGPAARAMATASAWAVALCERSSVTWAYSWYVGSQPGRYMGTFPRAPVPGTRQGYMFSTAILTSVRACRSAIPSTNARP